MNARFKTQPVVPPYDGIPTLDEEVQPTTQEDAARFMDGVITALCLCIPFWALVAGAVSFIFNLDL